MKLTTRQVARALQWQTVSPAGKEQVLVHPGNNKNSKKILKLLRAGEKIERIEPKDSLERRIKMANRLLGKNKSMLKLD